MFILFDHGTPKGLRHVLPGHTIFTAQDRGWDTRIATAVNAATPGSYIEIDIPFE